MRVSYWVRRYS